MIAVAVPESCLICHRRAFGYNYEVISCNACKMFFRRVSSSGMRKKCMFDGKCFDEDNWERARPHCRPCRYKKCLLVGMCTRSSSSSEDRPLSLIPSTFVTQDHIHSNLLQHLSLLHKTRMSVFEVINIQGDVSFCDLVAQGPRLGEYLRPQQVDWSNAQGKLKPWVSLGTILVVEMCKTMDFYNELLLSDRVLLLRSVAHKSHTLSISFDSYRRKKSKMLGPGDIELIPPVLNHIPEGQKFVDHLLSAPVEPLIKLSITENEYLLLNMIVICDPTVRGLSPGGQITLSRHRQLYARLLLDHCLIIDSREGAARFADILTVSQSLERMVYMTQKLVFLLRTHWNPRYAPCQLTYDSCRMDDCKWFKG